MKKTILVIDDEENLRKLLNRILDDAGYRVLLAPDGAMALETLKKQGVDLIMLDMNMPNMGGLEFLSIVKEKNISRAPVLMVSGETDTDLIVRCYGLGVYDFIRKPEQREVMLKRVENGLKIAEMIRYNDFIRSEICMAEKLQKYLFPVQEYEDDFFFVRAWSRPLSSIGGDLCNYIRYRDGRLVFFVADVAGHSISAALYTAMVSMLFRNAIRNTDTPGGILSYMHGEISQAMPVESFLTMVCGIIDPREGSLAYANAGHPRPYVMREGAWSELQGSSAFLSQITTTGFETYSTGFAPGDSFLAFTDGILDLAGPSGDIGGGNNLKSLMQSSPDAIGVFDGIRKTVTGGEFRVNDDCTEMLITLKRS